MEDNLNIEAIDKLRAQLAKDGISPILNEPDYLLKFLRARSLDVDQTVILIKTYLDYKAANAKMFNLPFRIKPVFETNVMRLLSTRSSSGEALILFRPGAWNPSLFAFDTILSATFISLEQAALDGETQKTGVLMIADCESFGWKQFKHFSPFQAKRLAILLEKIVPLKVNGINIYNQSRFAEMAWTVMKPFLSEHLRSSVSFHGHDYAHLQGFVRDCKLLPDSLGGQAGPLDCSDYYLELAKNETLFKSFGYC